MEPLTRDIDRLQVAISCQRGFISMHLSINNNLFQALLDEAMKKRLGMITRQVKPCSFPKENLVTILGLRLPRCTVWRKSCRLNQNLDNTLSRLFQGLLKHIVFYGIPHQVTKRQLDTFDRLYGMGGPASPTVPRNSILEKDFECPVCYEVLFSFFFAMRYFFLSFLLGREQFV